ncbi:hypothetical protein [Achromobacter sp.]|uniref:hypothetical protein n=1 Tax=Achromobacter sp. TaxID=134375 RepID=UPI002F9312B5
MRDTFNNAVGRTALLCNGRALAAVVLFLIGCVAPDVDLSNRLAICALACGLSAPPCIRKLGSAALRRGCI